MTARELQQRLRSLSRLASVCSVSLTEASHFAIRQPEKALEHWKTAHKLIRQLMAEIEECQRPLRLSVARDRRLIRQGAGWIVGGDS